MMCQSNSHESHDDSTMMCPSKSMMETTFPRLTHAGLGKPINEDNMRLSMHDASLSPAQSGVGKSRKCCFHHGSKSHDDSAMIARLLSVEISSESHVCS